MVKNSFSVILILFAICIVVLCGCVEVDKNIEEPTNHVDQDDIIGTWLKIDTFSNMTFNISYTFYSNMSFFSGVQNETSSEYEMSIWGNYSISDDIITLITQNPVSSSSLSFSISEDKQSLLLYYEDDINFDIFQKVE